MAVTDFDTKVAVAVRDDLAVCQRINVASFLVSGVVAAAGPRCKQFGPRISTSSVSPCARPSAMPMLSCRDSSGTPERPNVLLRAVTDGVPDIPDFDRDMELVPQGDGVWRAQVWRHWYALRGANGGLPVAQATRAMMLEVGDPARLPRSLTLHYLEAPTVGPLDYRVGVERAGRTATSISLRVTREDTLVALGLGWLGLWQTGGPEWTETVMPDVRPPEQAQRFVPGEGAPRMLANYDLRYALGAPPMSGAERSHIAAWIRTVRPRPLDHAALAAYADALFPAVWPRLTAMAFMPTLDLTLHWRAPIPAGEHPWVLGSFWSDRTAGGVFEENGELWSQDGQLLLQSRQLAIIRTPVAQG